MKKVLDACVRLNINKELFIVEIPHKLSNGENLSIHFKFNVDEKNERLAVNKSKIMIPNIDKMAGAKIKIEPKIDHKWMQELGLAGLLLEFDISEINNNELIVNLKVYI